MAATAPKYVTTEDFEPVKDGVDRLGQHIQSLTHRVDAMSNRFDGVSNRLDGVSNHVDALSSRVDGLSVRVEGLSSAVTSLTKDVADIAEDLTAHRTETADAFDAVGLEMNAMNERLLALTKTVENGHSAIVSLLQQLIAR